LPFEPIDITLVVPALTVSTPVVYRAWDGLDGPSAGGPSAGESSAGGPNDLEPAAILAYPALARWRDRIREAAGQSPTLAGSGATWFLRGHHDLEAAVPEAMVVHTVTCPGR
jgi:4-diphosphocytidyl-2-C-methyl-D-erythritol kinase